MIMKKIEEVLSHSLSSTLYSALCCDRVHTAYATTLLLLWICDRGARCFMVHLNEVLSNVCLRCECVPVCLSPQYLRYPQDTLPPTWRRILGLWGDCRTGRWQILCRWHWPPPGEGCSHSVFLEMRRRMEGGEGMQPNINVWITLRIAMCGVWPVLDG